MNRPSRHCLTLVLACLLSCALPSWGQEGESLNFCDIPCVAKIYKQYCGDAKCTTGASDYAQIFSLCTETCAGAVGGEAMMQCLTTSVPDRSDWDEVQVGVVAEIVSYCEGYEIMLNPNVAPLPLADTDKKLLKTLFDEPEEEKQEKKSKSKKKSKKSRKAKGGELEEDQEEETKKKGKSKESTEESPEKSKGKEPIEETPESTEAKGKGQSRRRGKDTVEEVADEVPEPVQVDSSSMDFTEQISDAFDAFGSLIGFDRDDMEEVLDTSLEESISE